MADFRDVLREAANAAGLEITGGDSVVAAPQVEPDEMGNLSVVWEKDNLQVQVNQIEQGKRSLDCYLSVRELSGKMIKAPVRLNLFSASAVTGLIRILNDRKPLDWASRVDQVTMAVHRTMAARRQVGKIERRTGPIEQDWLVGPLFERNQHSLVVAPGGTGKSLLMLAFCGSLTGSRPLVPGVTYSNLDGGVLYLDWETNKEIHDMRMTQLVPDDADWPDVDYMRMASTIMDEVQYLNEYIVTHNIKLVIVDSIGMACGGDMNTQTDAIAYINACRALGEVTVVSITHPGWDVKRSTGSRYFENAARSCWRIEKQQDEGDQHSHIDLTHYKSNNGLIHKPFALGVVFGEKIAYIHADVSQSSKSAREQIREVMDVGTPMALKAIYEDLPDIAKPTISKTLERMVKDGEVKKTGRAEYQLEQVTISDIVGPEVDTTDSRQFDVKNREVDTNPSSKEEGRDSSASTLPAEPDTKGEEDEDDPLPDF